MSARLPTEPTGPSASRERFSQRWFLGWAAVCGLLLVILGVAWFTVPRPDVLGLLGAAAAAAATVALHHLVVTRDLGERTLPRPPEVDELAPLRSRRKLFAGLGGAAAFLGLGGLASLLAFGPRRDPASAWADGGRVTTIEGANLRPQDLPLGAVITVWPPDAVGSELAAVMLLRLREMPEPPTRVEDVIDETVVAYSRICSHAGCAVALYRDVDQVLFCPCHQATFDARRGAEPVSGPASHPLPQLPLGIDADGFIIATGDLSSPPGAVGGTV